MHATLQGKKHTHTCIAPSKPKGPPSYHTPGITHTCARRRILCTIKPHLSAPATSRHCRSPRTHEHLRTYILHTYTGILLGEICARLQRTHIHLSSLSTPTRVRQARTRWTRVPLHVIKHILVGYPSSLSTSTRVRQARTCWTRVPLHIIKHIKHSVRPHAFGKHVLAGHA